MGISNLIISVIVIISDSNTKYIGGFADDIKDDNVIVVPVALSITVHLVDLSITFCFISGDALFYHNNLQFTTKDRDNDERNGNCAVVYHGAWWYRSCYNSNLNGKYLRGGRLNIQGIVWFYWKGYYYSLKRVNMKIRPNTV